MAGNNQELEISIALADQGRWWKKDGQTSVPFDVTVKDTSKGEPPKSKDYRKVVVSLDGKEVDRVTADPKTGKARIILGIGPGSHKLEACIKDTEIVATETIEVSGNREESQRRREKKHYNQNSSRLKLRIHLRRTKNGDYFLDFSLRDCIAELPVGGMKIVVRDRTLARGRAYPKTNDYGIASHRVVPAKNGERCRWIDYEVPGTDIEDRYPVFFETN